MEEKAEIKPVIFENRQNVTASTVVANIRENAGRDLPAIQFKKVCVCGSGPSLAEDIDLIRRRISKGYEVAAVNGAYGFLLDNDIIPQYFFMVDAQKDVNLPFLRHISPATKFFIASQCDPGVFKFLEDLDCDINLWQVGNAAYEGAAEAIREIDSDATIFGGACNVGQSCLFALMAMGYRHMDLFGFDGPTRDGATHAFHQPQNEGIEQRPWYFQGQEFNGTCTSAHDAMEFPDVVRTLRRYGVDVKISGDNLLQTAVKAAIKKDMGIPQMVGVPTPAKHVIRTNDLLPIVTMKWRGHIPYSGEDVNCLARQIDKHMGDSTRLICITDDAEGIDGSVECLPLWDDEFEVGRDWHRLKLFSEEMADLIGARFAVMDLDTVLRPGVGELFVTDAPFKALQDPLKPYQYNTALFMMTAGAYPHVWHTFNREVALKLRTAGHYNGYDEAWLSYALPNQQTWTKRSGVYSFRAHVAGMGDVLPDHIPEPEDAKLIHFHGKWNPRDEAVQSAAPWIADALS